MNIKNLKRNQIIIFVIALMLVSAGYLNFTANNDAVSTSSKVNILQEASIGDARLVSNNNVVDEEKLADLVSNDDLQNEENEEISSAVSTDEAVSTNSNEADEYFSSSKLTRDTMYSQMLEAYEKIMENPNIASDQKTIAQTEIKNINDTKNKIMICENLIKTKGLKDSVIFVNDDSISVVIKGDKLEENQIAQIQNIVSREMQVDITNIHISNK